MSKFCSVGGKWSVTSNDLLMSLVLLAKATIFCLSGVTVSQMDSGHFLTALKSMCCENLQTLWFWARRVAAPTH